MKMINKNNRILRLALCCLIITLTSGLMIPLETEGASTGSLSARSAAMGGAYTALAKGVDAAKFNPANLGLADYQQGGLELFSFGANISNNAFTLSDYNKYTGATLSTSDKQDILNKIPNEGFSLNANVRASAVSFSFGNTVFSFSGYGGADVNLNKDIIELLLNGNSFADTINVTGSYSDGISYASAAVSFGYPIYASGTRQLAIGMTGRYIKGVAIEEMIRLEGMASTEITGFQANGNAIFRTADGGKGYGLDVGATLKLNDNYTAGIRFENLLSHIGWNSNTEEHRYQYNFDTTTIDNMGADFIVSDDTTIAISGFSTTLPALMNVGFASNTGKLIWAIDWVQGFKRAPGSSTKPSISLGAEYALISILPIRVGYTAGGDQNSAFSFGSGLHFYGFYMDAAVITGKSFTVYSAKGANVALSMGYNF